MSIFVGIFVGVVGIFGGRFVPGLGKLLGLLGKILPGLGRFLGVLGRILPGLG